MLPTLAKDFYLPPQQRHGTSVMLSIFCSVLLCFMGLCKGSRLTGWADLDSLPVGACAVVGVTSRPLANQGWGREGSSAKHTTPLDPPPEPPHPQEDIMFHTCWQHMQCSHIQRAIAPRCSVGLGWQLFQPRMLWLFMRFILRSEQKADFHLARAKSLSRSLFSFQFL